MNLFLNVVSYESCIFSGLVKKIRVSGSEGELGIYPQHAPFLTFIKPGLLYVLNVLNKEKYMYISGGILEIQPSEVIILADIAIDSSNMDQSSILKEKEKIELKIKNTINNNKKNYLNNKLSKVIAKLYVIKTMEQSRLKG